MLERIIKLLPLLRCRRPRIFRIPNPLGEYAKCDQRDRSFGISCREKKTHVAAFGHTEHGRALGLRCFHDRAHIIHTLL